MRTYIKTYDLSHVRPESKIISWCKRNSFGRRGLICAALKYGIQTKTGYVLIAHDGKKKTGWAHIDDGNQFQCYVKPANRQCGIGSKLLAKATAKCGAVEVIPHDEASRNFFTANGLTKTQKVTGKRLKFKK